MTVTDRPEQIDLATRLSMAQAEVAPLRERVSQLEADLNAALERSDFKTADRLQAELGPARQEFGIAEATARVLAQTMQEIENARQAEQRKVAEQRRRDDLQRQVDELHSAEAEHREQMRGLIQAASIGVQAVRENLQRAKSSQGAATVALRECTRLLAELQGEQPPAYLPSVGEVDAVIERDAVLRAIFYDRQP